MGRVFVTAGGGVDSAASAALLCRQGYCCAGIFMITHDATDIRIRLRRE